MDICDGDFNFYPHGNTLSSFNITCSTRIKGQVLHQIQFKTLIRTIDKLILIVLIVIVIVIIIEVLIDINDCYGNFYCCFNRMSMCGIVTADVMFLVKAVSNFE